MSPRCLIIAGTHSGVGKTTVALAVMAALRQRGLRVQPFKIGPDFIDPGYHAAVCGRPSRNLDTWMLSEAGVRSTFTRAATDADVAVIEGVMGLFDGRGPDDPRGSTADLARLLNAPVVLVVDASGMGGSVAALVKGYCELDPAVRIAGILCNRVAGLRHYDYLEPAIRRHTPVEPLGWLPRRPEWAIPERHLGLMTAQDLGAEAGRWKQLGRALTETVDLDRLLALADTIAIAAAPPTILHKSAATRQRVAVAKDAAFCFYYIENLELLAAARGEIVPFSPLADPELPDGTDLVYLGGGYPELHAARLAANATMRDSIRRFHHQGGAIYAECGGMMYACRELVDGTGTTYPMLDLLPARTIMQPRRAALGYVTWRATENNLLGPSDTELRGHEFHYSRLEPLGDLRPSALLHRDSQPPKPDGFARDNLLAGYAHLHFGSNPEAVQGLFG